MAPNCAIASKKSRNSPEVRSRGVRQAYIALLLAFVGLLAVLLAPIIFQDDLESNTPCLKIADVIQIAGRCDRPGASR